MHHRQTPSLTTAASAPTRVCLGGEDLDWLGGPALLAAIELRITVEFARDPHADTLTIDAHGALQARLSLTRTTWNEPTSSELELVRLCWQHGATRPAAQPGGRITVASAAPPGAGLATSATTCVAAVHAMTDRNDDAHPPSPADLILRAFNVERWFGGRPVGPMDFVPAVYGGTTLVETESETITRITAYELPPDALFIVLDTRTPRDTGAVIAWKRRRLAEGDTNIRTYADQTAALVAEQAALLRDGGDLDGLGQTIDRAHALLADQMQASTPLIDACVAQLRANGALGAKLTGTGHGGCVVGLTTTEHAERVVAAVAELPVTAYVVAPAPSGVAPTPSTTDRARAAS